MNSSDKILIQGILGEGSTAQDYQLKLYDDEGIDGSRKCTSAEKELRKKLIRKLIIGGISRRLILDYCSQFFGIRQKQVNRYLTEIYEEFGEIGKHDAEVNFGLMIERLESALSETILTGDMGNRVKILKEINDVLGIKTTNHNITGDMDFRVIIDDEITVEDEDNTSGSATLAETGLEGP